MTAFAQVDGARWDRAQVDHSTSRRDACGAAPAFMRAPRPSRATLFSATRACMAGRR